MGLRDWTRWAIEDGDSPQWAVGIAIKLGVESVVAAVLGWIATAILLYVFPLDALSDLLGTSTFASVWLATAGGILVSWTRCKYTVPLSE